MKLISENKIDALGRVTLPAQIRHKLGMDKGDSVDIFEDNGIINRVFSADILKT